MGDHSGEESGEDFGEASGEDFEEASGELDGSGAELDEYDSEEVVADQLRMEDQGSDKELYAANSDL